MTDLSTLNQAGWQDQSLAAKLRNYFYEGHGPKPLRPDTEIGRAYHHLLRHPSALAHLPEFGKALRATKLLTRDHNGNERLLTPPEWKERSFTLALRQFCWEKGRYGIPPGQDETVRLSNVNVPLGKHLSMLNQDPALWREQRQLASEVFQQRELLAGRGRHTDEWDRSVGYPQIRKALDVRTSMPASSGYASAFSAPTRPPASFEAGTPTRVSAAAGPSVVPAMTAAGAADRNRSSLALLPGPAARAQQPHGL